MSYFKLDLIQKYCFSYLEARYKLEFRSPNTLVCIKQNILGDSCHSEKGSNGCSTYSFFFVLVVWAETFGDVAEVVKLHLSDLDQRLR